MLTSSQVALLQMRNETLLDKQVEGGEDLVRNVLRDLENCLGVNANAVQITDHFADQMAHGEIGSRLFAQIVQRRFDRSGGVRLLLPGGGVSASLGLWFGHQNDFRADPPRFSPNG